MNPRRVILLALAVALGLWIAVTAADGDLDGEHSPPGTQTGTTGIPLRYGSTGGILQPHAATLQSRPRALKPRSGPRVHPRVPARVRTHPRLRPRAGHRNTVFALTFRLRRHLGPHGRRSTYYGVVVSPLAARPRQGCYGFGRYVTNGRRGQIVRVALHPRDRRWCRGGYEAAVYLTGRPACKAQPNRPQACSTASYPAIPTGWADFTVR